MAKKEKDSTKNVIPEMGYSRAEILSAASSFDVMPEVLAGALSLSEKEKLSRSEIESLIKRFKGRKVQK